eukprot:TRINITY_DN4068_c0_g1_i1.p1 TRINITY_DN4068_c0_g1~~TRINITY_DN4068_c0_g1_i1.p1  ORF type:complete len:1138 (-),score=235.04 TRINITY_DN4068_c0_g1_i1:2085-5447(-)
MEASSWRTDDKESFSNSGLRSAISHSVLDRVRLRLEQALFGMLFTIVRENNFYSNLSLIAILIEWSQMITFALSSKYPWGQTTGVVFFYTEQIQLSVYRYGEDVFVITFWTCFGLVFLTIILAVFVSLNFMMGWLRAMWPIQLLRLLSSLLIPVFYIPLLKTLLQIFACDTVPFICSSPHYSVYIAASLVSMFLLIPFALLMSFAYFDPQPNTSYILAKAHTYTDLLATVAKTILSILLVMVTNKVAVAVVIVLFMTAISYMYTVTQPYYHPYMNRLRILTNSSVVWAGVVLLAVVIINDRTKEAATIVFYAGLVPVSAIMALLAYVYERRIFTSRDVKADDDAITITKTFDRAISVELAARLARRGHFPDVPAHSLMDAIFSSGLKQQPSAYVHIMHAMYIEAFWPTSAGSQADIRNCIERARNMEQSFLSRFLLYLKDKEAEQAFESHSHGDVHLDVLQFVEFRQNFDAAQRFHQTALHQIRAFWKQLSTRDVSAKELWTASRRITGSETRAEDSYRSLIRKFPKSSKLWRSYGDFYSHVSNDPIRANYCYSRASRCDEEQAHDKRAAEKVAFLRDGAAKFAGAGGSDGVVVIDAQGVIKSINSQALKVFGYKRSQLVGQNVKLLMPSPYREQHDGYLKEYWRSGRARILGRIREEEAITSDGVTFPVKLCVTRSEVAGEVFFVGRVSKRKAADANMTVDSHGVILTCSEGSRDVFGYAAKELIGKNISMLVPAHVRDVHDGLIERYLVTNKSAVVNAGPRNVNATHRSGQEVAVSLSVAETMIDTERIFTCQCERVSQLFGMVTVDGSSMLISSNPNMQKLFGFSLAELLDMHISTLLPELAVDNLVYNETFVTAAQHSDRSRFRVQVLARDVSFQGKQQTGFSIGRVDNEHVLQDMETAGTLSSGDASSVYETATVMETDALSTLGSKTLIRSASVSSFHSAVSMRAVILNRDQGGASTRHINTRIVISGALLLLLAIALYICSRVFLDGFVYHSAVLRQAGIRMVETDAVRYHARTTQLVAENVLAGGAAELVNAKNALVSAANNMNNAHNSLLAAVIGPDSTMSAAHEALYTLPLVRMWRYTAATLNTPALVLRSLWDSCLTMLPMLGLLHYGR